MIIKKLVLKNFGSYFKKTEINFPSSGFFLISGPTGSGKTTILEGISFALFGKVPRYEGMGRGLGSIISKNEDTKKSKSKLLEVELEFILNEQLYHLRRSVEFLLKGDEESAKNSEVEFRTDQKVLAVKPKEYEEIICKLLGMENIGSAYDTFTKSIFLPQNAFDRFLYLKPAERKNLVFELLNLNVYEKVKEKIKDEYSKLKASINTLEQQKELKQRNIQEEIEKISSFDNDQIMEFKSKVECSKEKILILRNILKNSILDLMKSTLELIQQMENIEFKDVDWGQYESEINDFCNTLSFNYQNFKLIYQRYVNIQREKQRLLNIRDENKKIVNLHNYFYIKEIFYDYNISDIRTNIIEIINDIKELQELDIKISQSEERIGKVEAELKNINYTLVKLSEILEKQYQQEEKFRTDLEELEQQIQQKKQKLDIKQSVLELQRVIHENKLEKCLVCSSQLIQENKSFIQSSLEKGKSSITQIIKEKEAKVEEIKKRLKEINSEIIKNQRKFTSLRSEKEQKEYQINQLKQEIRNYEDKKNRINASFQKNTVIIDKIKLIINQIFGLKDMDLSILERLSEYLRDLDHMTYLIQKIREYADIDSEFRMFSEYHSLSQIGVSGFENLRLSDLNKKMEKIKKIIEKFKMEQYDKIQQILFSENFEKTHESMNSDFMELFNISGKINEKLDSVKSVRNKKEKIDDNLNRIHENLEELIQLGFREFGISILEKEIDFKINNIKRMKQNILENLKDIIQEYTSLQELTAKYYDELENNYENVNRLLISLQVIKNSEQEIKEINNKIESLREDFRIISFLKDDFEGSGRKKDFLTFVFNVVFELISQKANSILGEITEGRYVIGFKDDIEILDNWYGMKRNVRSLSGGEKFLASLSIAMAISELMSTSKYKVKSMFIDEGFGTLDMDTLNDVVDYLENYFYNHSDKVLGIITHVEEIKYRFNYVIRVTKTKNGSEIQVINNI